VEWAYSEIRGHFIDSFARKEKDFMLDDLMRGGMCEEITR